jgi:vacuolar protein sorting-associated protein 13D
LEELAAQEYKLSLLDEMEARWRAEMESAQTSSYYATSYSSWLSFGTGVVANIIENIQVSTLGKVSL